MSPKSLPPAPALAPLDRRRYLRIVLFFAGAFLYILTWDLLLRRVPGLRGLARRTAAARWQHVALRFRTLAVQLGGVLIKLGQFLSIRVDVLPQVVTSVLAGLQDEVPAETPEDVEAVIAGEFGRPSSEVFAWFATLPTAAASLAQVHAARLPDGQEVVVKVQRRRIATLVETDLAALRIAVTWLKLYRPLARRVDLDRLLAEFDRTTRAELDYTAEGHNAEHFAADFADDMGIHIPQVYWTYSSLRVLTLENVAGIKITDLPAMQAAGISRAEVARRLYDTYLRQVFLTNFVHADPHPGNLFLRLLPPAPDAAPDTPRPFLLIFVDFGMVAVVPERLRTSLQEYAIALATQDAHRLVQAYADAGILLPGADRRRLVELHEVLFERLGGVKLGELHEAALEQARVLMREYRDILFDMPFQFPTDVLFVARAIAILSGIATTLDPSFDPWAAMIPFAARLADEQSTLDWRTGLSQLGDLARLALRLPARLDRFMSQAERGELTVQSAMAPDTARAFRRLERAVHRLTWIVVAGVLLLAGLLVQGNQGGGGLSSIMFVGAGMAFVWALAPRG